MARFLSTQMAFVCLTLFLGYTCHYGLLPGTPRTGIMAKWQRGGVMLIVRPKNTVERGWALSKEP